MLCCLHACHHPLWVPHPPCWHLPYFCKLANGLEEVQEHYEAGFGSDDGEVILSPSFGGPFELASFAVTGLAQSTFQDPKSRLGPQKISRHLPRWVAYRFCFRTDCANRAAGWLGPRRATAPGTFSRTGMQALAPRSARQPLKDEEELAGTG